MAELYFPFPTTTDPDPNTKPSPEPNPNPNQGARLMSCSDLLTPTVPYQVGGALTPPTSSLSAQEVQALTPSLALTPGLA